MVHAGGREQAPGPVGQQRDLLPGRHGQRVHQVVGAPLDPGVHRLGGTVDPLAGERRQRAGDADGPLRRRRGPLGGELDVRGETPRAVDEHAHREPLGRGVDDTRDAGVAQLDRLRHDPLHPHVGVLGTELPGPAQRGVREPRERQRAECRVDPLGVDPVRHGGTLTGPTDSCTVTLTRSGSGPNNTPSRPDQPVRALPVDRTAEADVGGRVGMHAPPGIDPQHPVREAVGVEVGVHEQVRAVGA